MNNKDVVDSSKNDFNKTNLRNIRLKRKTIMNVKNNYSNNISISKKMCMSPDSPSRKISISAWDYF